MSVITISRGSFSGGKTLAECLAVKLGYRCIGRETIVERAAAGGVSHDELLAALLKPPGFLERFGHKRYQYLTVFQAALAEEVRDGNVVYHGNAGHLMLKGAPPVLRIRIIAPIEMRLATARSSNSARHPGESSKHLRPRARALMTSHASTMSMCSRLITRS